MTSTFGMLDMARSFRISHPSPPAPTTNTRAVERMEWWCWLALGDADGDADGSNSPIGSAPVSLAKGDARERRVASDPRL